MITERNGYDFQMQRFGQHLEPGIGQRVGGNHIAGFEQRHQRHCEALLGAVDDQHLLGLDPHPARQQVPRDRRALVAAPGVRLITQQRLQIAGQRQLAQRSAQQIRLTGQRRIIEIEVDHADRHLFLIDALPRRQRGFADKRAAPGLAADQAHGLQLCIYPRGRDQRQPFLSGQLPVGRQPCTRRQHPRADVRRVGVNQCLVARTWHAGCIHDNSLIVLILGSSMAAMQPTSERER
ncbi:hypothetical protein D3C81_1466830 [compost metagenome]